MIHFERKVLDNGLRVLVNTDTTTQLVTVNVLYNVGARDEEEEKTGFAHLFEHLMFEGSKHIPHFDKPVEDAGGSSNAFTSNDITNYYITLPAVNIETAFWLESDRMLELDFSQEKLDVQKKVVIEEFKERYLNNPYGDVWHKLRSLCYKKHPYKWPTIGISTQHVADATLDYVKEFFYTHYAPNNAILVVSGNASAEQVFELAEKWFGPIPARTIHPRNLPQEDEQTEARLMKVEAKVPKNMLYMAFPMPGFDRDGYHAVDFLTEVLGYGESSRLFESLVVQQHIFDDISSYVFGSLDDGLAIISGMPSEGISFEDAESKIWEQLEKLYTEQISETEMARLLNKAETSEAYELDSTQNRALKLAMFENIGDANRANTMRDRYKALTPEILMETAKKYFVKSKSNVLQYNAI